MRGNDPEPQSSMWSYVPMERRIPAEHPLRRMRPLVDAALPEPPPQFEGPYSRVGRPSIAPEKLLRAPLLQVPRATAGPPVSLPRPHSHPGISLARRGRPWVAQYGRP
jgi:hypothetical protein